MSEKARGYLPHEAAEHQGHKQLTAWLRAFVQQDGAAARRPRRRGARRPRRRAQKG